MTVESLVLKSAIESLEQFVDRIEACLAKLTPEQIWARGHENENAIGNLVLHLDGNVTQWILSGLGGAPDHRVRHLEFEAKAGASADLRQTPDLRQTIDKAIEVIRSLDAARLTRPYKIQNYETTGVEALLHVVEHFGQHTGQIIFATKLLTGQDLGFYRHLNP